MSGARLAYVGGGFTPEHREAMADYYDDIENPEFARIYRHTHEELLRMCIYMVSRDPGLVDDAVDYIDEVFGT